MNGGESTSVATTRQMSYPFLPLTYWNCPISSRKDLWPRCLNHSSVVCNNLWYFVVSGPGRGPGPRSPGFNATISFWPLSLILLLLNLIIIPVVTSSLCVTHLWGPSVAGLRAGFWFWSRPRSRPTKLVIKLRQDSCIVLHWVLRQNSYCGHTTFKFF